MLSRHAIATAVASVALGLMGTCGAAGATLQPTRPATQAFDLANAQNLTARVSGVRGVVQVRADENSPWQPARVGMILPVGAECRTGPRSAIELTLPPDQKLTLDRLGTVKILEALVSQNKVKTDIGMPYGRVQYRIEAAGAYEHDTTVRSPSSSLAVRGTDFVMIDDGILAKTTLLQSRVQTPNVNEDLLLIGTPGAFYGDRYVELDETDVSPAEHELEEAATPFLDFNIITSGESGAFIWNNSITSPTGVREFRFYPYQTGAIPSFDSMEPPPPPPPPPVDPAKGTLSFNLTWVGNQASGAGTPDLDLFVISPRGERLFPSDKGTVTVPSGGTISRNNRGGVKVPLGVENARWSKTYPLGDYRYGVIYRGSGDPANYRIIVVQNGRQINSTFDDTVTQFDRRVNFNIDVEPPQNARSSTKGKGKGTATPARLPAGQRRR